ncbi:MAG: hypothetical protein G01um101425_460 [Candidatus Peregrinibacteria bacterium Gr01-1014_25]|nr:MAG: hypothetical protein G01um101425_460 [Candidatus Peregrinibacteria bacterium Gr01-1014_25]
MEQPPVPVDGIVSSAPPPAAAAPAPETKKREAAVKRWKMLLPTIGGGATVLYLLWAFFLVAVLPDATGKLNALVPIGVMSAVIAAVLAIGVGVLGLQRIASSPLPTEKRQRSLIFLILPLLPTLVASAGMPFLILREPVLSMEIIRPTLADDFVAPVNVTYSVRSATETLTAQGLRVVNYLWDLNGDGKADEETVVPELTVTYDREDAYAAAVRIVLADGSFRRASRRIVIRRSVFTLQPRTPLIERPVFFDVSNVVTDQQSLKEVQWDFTGDGQVDETTKEPRATFTYFKLGPVTVSATVLLANNTQTTYQRTIEVVVPPPLAFSSALLTEPRLLISPPPFGVRFRIATEEPLAQVAWTFGDGAQGEGQQIAHTYDGKGVFPVLARVRSKTGSLVELSTLVRVSESLSLPDLRFDGTPEVSGDTIKGEVPLTLSLRPRTAVPFVTFSWEAPEATEVGSTEDTLQAIYRRDGTYSLHLVAQDAEDHVYRKVYTIEVQPRSRDVLFVMRPESGVAPLRVQFDASESFIPGQEITGYEWSFGDRTPSRTGSARAEHMYQQPGTYVVDLIVRTVKGEEYRTSKTIVVRPPILTPCISASRTTLKAGGGVQLSSDCSTGTWDSLVWDFGDGSQTDEKNPIHIFERPGEYTVTLTLREAQAREAATTTTITVTE